MSTAGNDTTVSWEDHVVSVITNNAFAAIYILCTVIGVPGNIVSVVYFTTSGIKSSKGNNNKSFFNVIYIMTACVDTLICATLLPQIVSFLKQREEAWYGNTPLCYIWGIIWEILPYMSVFLVGIMSISRTTILIKPLHKLKLRTLWVFIVTYLIFLVFRTALPVLMKDASYMYWVTEVYCYEMPSADWAYKFNSVTRTTTLAVPVIPICISCISSYVIIKLNARRQAAQKKPRSKLTVNTNRKLTAENSIKSRKGQANTMHATFTILIFTGAYILFNIPVFLNYLLMAISSFVVECNNDCYLRAYEGYPFLIWYSWNFTYIMCVALNSTLNPLIYYWRMHNVQSYVNSKLSSTSMRILRIPTQLSTAAQNGKKSELGDKSMLNEEKTVASGVVETPLEDQVNETIV